MEEGRRDNLMGCFNAGISRRAGSVGVRRGLAVGGVGSLVLVRDGGGRLFGGRLGFFCGWRFVDDPVGYDPVGYDPVGWRSWGLFGFGRGFLCGRGVFFQ